MNKKQKIQIGVLGVSALLILTAIVGYTYSFFSATIKENNKTETIIKTNTLGLTFTGDTEISALSMIPGDSFTKTFKVENTSNIEVTYNIYMDNVVNEFNEDLVYTLTDETGEVVAETATPESNTGKTYILKNIHIAASAVKTYTLKVEYKYLETPQNDYQGKSFTTTVGIDTEQFKEEAKACNVVSGDGTSVGSEIACGTENFYVLSSDESNVRMLSKYNVDTTSNLQSTTAAGVAYQGQGYDVEIAPLVNNYASTLTALNMTATVDSASSSDLLAAGCVDGFYGLECNSAINTWIYSSWYFTKEPGKSGGDIVVVNGYGYVSADRSEGEEGYEDKFGIRPVVTIPKTDIKF